MDSINSLLQRDPKFGRQIQQLVVQVFKSNPTNWLPIFFPRDLITDWQ